MRFPCFSQAAVRAAILCVFFPACSQIEDRRESRRADCTVRFHVEVDALSPSPFSIPARLQNPPRQIFVEGSALLGERVVEGVYVFPSEDDSWGALFKLDRSGSAKLTQISTAHRGRSLVVFVGNAKSVRQLPNDIFIDRIVSDGLLPIPRGLTYAEAMHLQKHLPPIQKAPAPPTEEAPAR